MTMGGEPMIDQDLQNRILEGLKRDEEGRLELIQCANMFYKMAAEMRRRAERTPSEAVQKACEMREILIEMADIQVEFLEDRMPLHKLAKRMLTRKREEAVGGGE